MTDRRQSLRRAASALLAFAVLCFLTSLVMGSTTGPKLKTTLPSTGGEVGPIEVNEANSVYQVSVEHNTSNQSYRYIEGSLLDAEKEYLFGFGDEMWQESGYDEGHWSERDDHYSINVTIPEVGRYYMEFSSEGNSTSTSSIIVELARLRGSSLPHLWLGVFAILAAVLCWFLSEKSS